ncbi:MAG: efflux RND transporter periplasmic adaptor subunit [Pirellulales bacterium]
MKQDLTPDQQTPGGGSGQTTTGHGAAPRRLPLEALRIATPLLILLGGLVGFAALRGLKADPLSEPHAASDPLVESVAVQAHEGGLSFTVDGIVVPFREISLSAEVAGRIAHKEEVCRAGNFVTRGTPLLEIDSRDYELEVKRLEGELAQSEVSLQELDVEVANNEALVELAREQLALLHKELERVEALVGRRVVTDSEVDRIRREELTGKNSVRTLDNQLQLLNTRRHRLESARDLSRTQLEKAQLDLERTKIVSPVDGVIVEEMVEEDSYVQKGAELATLDDTSAVEVRCNLRMDQLMWLWSQRAGTASEPTVATLRGDYQVPPAPVTVVYELLGKRFEWDGVLSRFDGIGVEERTRTVPCRVLVAKPREVRVRTADGQATSSPVGPPALVRGMYVTLRVQTDSAETLLEIPEGALRPGGKVWEIVDGHLVIRQVRVAHNEDGVVLFHAAGSELAPGAKLVNSPLAVAVDGMPIRERDAE